MFLNLHQVSVHDVVDQKIISFEIDWNEMLMKIQKIAFSVIFP